MDEMVLGSLNLNEYPVKPIGLDWLSFKMQLLLPCCIQGKHTVCVKELKLNLFSHS